MNQNNTRVLYEAYNIYYENGIEAISKNNYETAARNLYNASETLLKLAKESEGALKTTRIKRADELYQMAESIKKKPNRKETKLSKKALLHLPLLVIQALALMKWLVLKKQNKKLLLK